MLRKGKIARLPRPLRDELNCRLSHNEDGGTLLDWLNAAPDVQAMLARDFAGEPISKQNLHEWRNGGLLEWQTRLDLLEQARDLAVDAGPWDPATCGKLTENMATMLVVRHAALLARWDGGDNETFRTQLRILHSLTRDLVALRRILQSAASQKTEPAPRHRNGIESISAVTAECMQNTDRGGALDDLLPRRQQPPAPVPMSSVVMARASATDKPSGSAAAKHAADQGVPCNTLSSRTDRFGSDQIKESPTRGAVGSNQVKPTAPNFGTPHPELHPSAVPVVTSLGSAVDQFVAACAPSPQTGFLPSALRREISEVLTKNQK